ncbi:phosphate:acyl-[acyl carrier protein] acyltransferase [Fusobacterium naviforme]|uniref:Phosphate acyltransferase n=1 Tax=Moryella indoligenes TaxID=371674 RepID=A0AAE3V9R3_9FIRM|nr:phosphate acyltransferase PlsX [Moryella indoligenes]KAB0577971.1 phosphate acyltransferase PlsX [Fusobacterium naviforme]MDQ0152356.1 glycerol-3-phosphate acyltransferase PlsX [Moryella indoligenes]PSL10768.1 phosphate:acyl-[acyl carrier protein] acyltransferase [Fusobacterium naviforme]STO27318.1 Phosphate acyltransferase [Fusobacterium naviforme]
MVRVAVDVMGGDNAPGEIIKGCLKALRESAEIQLFLVGREEAIQRELEGESYDAVRLHIVNATEVIETGEAPVLSIRKKKDSSIVRGMRLVREQEADAFVSAGSSGAILVGGQLIVGRISGVERAPFAPLVPTDRGGVTLLLDAGANVDARPKQLLQFAKMGSIYMEHVMGIPAPRVAILNIGVEEEKGNALVKETFPLLKAAEGINFTGSIEAREVVHGAADVCVCEAFTGNMVLKTIEGTASALLHMMKNACMSSTRSKLGALLLKPALKETLQKFDATRHGGAPMLGLRGLVVKVHGNAGEGEICNAILQCRTFHEAGINHYISKELNLGAGEDQGDCSGSSGASDRAHRG